MTFVSQRLRAGVNFPPSLLPAAVIGNVAAVLGGEGPRMKALCGPAAKCFHDREIHYYCVMLM